MGMECPPVNTATDWKKTPWVKQLAVAPKPTLQQVLDKAPASSSWSSTTGAYPAFIHSANSFHHLLQVGVRPKDKYSKEAAKATVPSLFCRQAVMTPGDMSFHSSHGLRDDAYHPYKICSPQPGSYVWAPNHKLVGHTSLNLEEWWLAIQKFIITKSGCKSARSVKQYRSIHFCCVRE